jgi:hypothetical protein
MAITLPTDPITTKFPTLGAVIGKLLPYIYVVAGLCLLFMLISGGITLMTAAGDAGKTKEGYGKLTAGLIGFLIIFVSYFVAQIVEVVLGVKFL